MLAIMSGTDCRRQLPVSRIHLRSQPVESRFAAGASRHTPLRPLTSRSALQPGDACAARPWCTRPASQVPAVLANEHGMPGLLGACRSQLSDGRCDASAARPFANEATSFESRQRSAGSIAK